MENKYITLLSTILCLILFSSCHTKLGTRDNNIPLKLKKNLGEIAYKDIRFGENYSDITENRIAFFEEVGKCSYSTNTYFVINTQKENYDLYRISFKSYYYHTADYYDTAIRYQWQNLIDVISARYGNKNGVYPEFLQHKSGCIIWTHVWTIEKKELRIGVGTEDARYFAVLWITDLDRENIVEDRIKQDEIKSKKASSEKF